MTVPAAIRTKPAPASSWPRTRVRIALFLVFLYASVSALRWLHLTAQRPAVPVIDEISAYERRFHDLRSALPDRGMVGYIGYPEPTGATPSDSNAAALLHFRRLLLAQYALAPIILVQNTEPELLVGNFIPGAVPPAPHGFSLVRDFGDGLVLFRRSDP